MRLSSHLHTTIAVLHSASNAPWTDAFHSWICMSGITPGVMHSFPSQSDASQCALCKPWTCTLWNAAMSVPPRERDFRQGAILRSPL